MTSPSHVPTEPVRRVGRGFFPLDEELVLLPGSLAPNVQEHLAHVASWMPLVVPLRC